MARKDDLGRHGEQAAVDYLIRAGWEILERNWRCPLGELDVVALDGRDVVVVEVKTRRSVGFGHPLEAVTSRKRRRLRHLAREWAGSNPAHLAGRTLRVDAIAVIVSPASIEHVRDIA